MNRFFQLFRRQTPPPPGEIHADDRPEQFPIVVSGSNRLVWWPIDRPAPPAGTFLLAGVGPWSGYDMRLLDAIDAAPDGPDVIGVFDIDACQTPDDVYRRFPGIGEVGNPPVIGLWRDGRLVETGYGPFAHKLALSACGLDPNDRSVLNPFIPDPDSCPAPTPAGPTPSGR